jgi:hypothetical protein
MALGTNRPLYSIKVNKKSTSVGMVREKVMAYEILVRLNGMQDTTDLMCCNVAVSLVANVDGHLTGLQDDDRLIFDFCDDKSVVSVTLANHPNQYVSFEDYTRLYPCFRKAKRL